MRKNQKGFTLVELIIAVAILAIVTAAVCGFIVVGSRSYASSNTDIMLQQDAQLALNQMSDVIIDTTDSISYGLSTSGSGDMQLVLKDSEFAGEATEKCLIVVNRKEDDSNNDNPSYWFYWSKDEEIIYFNEVAAYSSSMSADEIADKFKDAGTDKAILAQHVTDFSIDISQFEANRVVMISMTFENGNRTYSTSNNVTVRNRIALNEITVGPLKRAQDFEINTVRNVTVEPGEYINLGPRVTVESSSGDTALKWEFVGGAMNGTTLSESNGQLNIGIGETRESFSVKVSRVNEEYVGQNDRVAKTIQVNVKRATDVKINGPSSAKQGEEISLTAYATDRSGLLGMPCDSDGHPLSLNISKDKDVDTWRVMSGDAIILTSDSGSASVKIGSTAAVGSKIVIRAESTLSKAQGYGPLDNPTVSPVWGELEITVTQGSAGALPMGSGFEVGTDNPEDGNLHRLSFLYKGFEPYTSSEYIVYARVKDPVGGQPDRVLIYRCSGENLRFYPDMFGLYWNRSYELYLQAILPVPTKFIEENKAKVGNDFSAYDNLYNDQVVAELLDPNNIDPSTGEYIGTNFPKGEYFVGTLDPPRFSLKVDGVEYPSDNPDQTEKYNLLNGGERGLSSVEIGQKYSNVSPNTLRTKNMLKYSIYKEVGGNWNRIAGYNPTNESYDNGTTFKFASDMFEVSVGGNPFIKRDINKKDTNATLQAIGNYRVVVGYEYQNDPWAGSSTKYTFLYPTNYPNTGWDYSKHYYEREDCFVPWTVNTGLTLKLSYEGQGDEEENINFPLPTDSNFPFGGNTWDIYGQYYDVYSKSGQWLKGISGVHVACTYNNGEYTITLSGVETKGKVELTTAYGTYRWKPGFTEWECIDAGKGGAQITGSTWGPRIYFDYWGTPYMMELALPSDPGFPKDAINESKYEINIQGNGIAYKESDTAGTGYDWINVWLRYEYDSSTGTYTVTMFTKEWDGEKEYGKWTCESNGTEWRKVK